MGEQVSGSIGVDRPVDGAFIVGTSQGLGGFVDLHVRSGANRIGNSFAVDIRLEVDEWRLRIERKSGLLRKVAGYLLSQPEPEVPTIDLRVRLRHCYVRYRCDCVSIPADSKYRSAVEIGAYSATQAASDRSATSSDRTGRLDLAGALGPKPTASLAGSYRVGASWQDSVSVERTITASQDLYEVEAVPGGWRVGDRTHGDPLKRDGCLDGPYFGRAVEGRSHSCMVEFQPGCTVGTIDFAVTTRDGLHVETVDGEPVSRTHREAGIAAMRDRLAAICIEQAIAEPAADEAVLFTVQAFCSMATEPHGTADDRDAR